MANPIIIPPTDVLWKPPPVLCEDKDAYRWFWRIVEILNHKRALATFVYEVVGNQFDQPPTTPSGTGTPTGGGTVANTVYNINWGVIRRGRNIYLDPADPTKVFVKEKGIYTFNFSLELFNLNNTTKIATIWAAINGVNVQSTARNTGITDQSMPVTPSWSYSFEMAAGDYFQLRWLTDLAGCYLHTTAATANAPSASAAALTVMQIGYDPPKLLI